MARRLSQNGDPSPPSPFGKLPVAVVLLAAGGSTRLGRPKQLLVYRGTTLIRRMAEAALRSRAQSVVVVLGAHAARVRPALHGLPLQVVENLEWESGISSSIRAGIRTVPPSCQAILFMAVDQVYVTADLLDRLLSIYEESATPIVASSYAGTRGIPVLFARTLFPLLLSLAGDSGAKQIIEAHAHETATVDFPRGSIDLDRPEDLQELPTINTVIFDFGMVISSFDVTRFLRNLIPLTGKRLEELAGILTRVRDIVLAYERGELCTDDFTEQFLRRADLKISPGQFQQAYNDIFTPIPSTSELIRKLKPRYRLGLLSNTSELHFHHAIESVDVFPLFDAVTLSFQVGVLKPSEAIYRDMLAKLRAAPRECAYIDDLQENVDAAARLGMHVLKYTSSEELLSGLRILGLEF
jgi:molybdenum cofactor cytidylyltransferase